MAPHTCRCHDIHLATTISKGDSFPALHHYVDQCFGANPVSCRFIIKEQGGVMHGYHPCHFFADGSFMAGTPLLSGPAPWEFKCSLCHLQKCPNVDSPWQNGWSPYKAPALLTLEVAHTCIMCRLNPSNLSNLGGSPLSTSGSGGNKSSSSSMATLPAGVGYLLYLSS